MAGVKLSSIRNILKDYENSDKGKKHIRTVVEDYRKKGINSTGAGSKVLSEKDMMHAANILAQLIKDCASAKGSDNIPGSIIDILGRMSCGKPYEVSDGNYRVDMFFTDDLRRESLYDDYNGVENIIALFNNGYLASDYVYGDWDGHKPTGEARFDSRSIESSPHIRSRLSREALGFMQEAVDYFNTNYGPVYGATAILADIYRETPTVGSFVSR